MWCSVGLGVSALGPGSLTLPVLPVLASVVQGVLPPHPCVPGFFHWCPCWTRIVASCSCEGSQVRRDLCHLGDATLLLRLFL